MITVLLMELCHYTLLGVETRVTMNSGSLFDFFLGGVIKLIPGRLTNEMVVDSVG
jgi:hypothetical protein